MAAIQRIGSSDAFLPARQLSRSSSGSGLQEVQIAQESPISPSNPTQRQQSTRATHSASSTHSDLLASEMHSAIETLDSSQFSQSILADLEKFDFPDFADISAEASEISDPNLPLFGDVPGKLLTTYHSDQAEIQQSVERTEKLLLATNEDKRFTDSLLQFAPDRLERFTRNFGSVKGLAKSSPLAVLITPFEANTANRQHKGFKSLMEEAIKAGPERILAKNIAYQLSLHYGQKTRQRIVDTGVGVVTSTISVIAPPAQALANASGLGSGISSVISGAGTAITSKGGKTAMGSLTKDKYKDGFKEENFSDFTVSPPNNLFSEADDFKGCRALLAYLAEPRRMDGDLPPGVTPEMEQARMELRHDLGALNDEIDYLNPSDMGHFTNVTPEEDQTDLNQLISRKPENQIKDIQPEARDFLRSFCFLENWVNRSDRHVSFPKF